MIYRCFGLLFVLGSLPNLQAQITNLILPALEGPNSASVSMSVKSNQVARILHLFGGALGTTGSGKSWFVVRKEGYELRYDVEVLMGATTFTLAAPIITGPAEVGVSVLLSHATDRSVPLLCVIQLTSSEDTLTPSSAVVIPADSNGPVRIVLESSVDTVTWTEASPGVYGTSTEKRFFRVRAVRQ